MHTLATLLEIATLGFLVFLVRPQLAFRFGWTVPSRRKLLIPFFACWILAAVVSHTARQANNDDNLQSSNSSENASAVRASYVSPERRELATIFVEVKKLADLSDNGGLPEQQHPGCTASVIQLVKATGPLSDDIYAHLDALRKSNTPDAENDISMSPIYREVSQMLGPRLRNTKLICGL